MDPNVELDLTEDRGEKVLEDIADYQAVVGSLIYAALETWPDISYVVAAVSHYNSQPFSSHMTAATRVLQYLKSIDDFRLHFSRIGIGIDISNSRVGYSDSHRANGSVDRNCQGGHGCIASNGALSWQSRKQSLLAMSTLHAVFIACLEASSEAE